LATRFVIRVDLERVRQSLSQADGTEWTTRAVTDWLQAAGFISRADGTWLVREKDIGQLSPEEVTEIAPFDEGES